MPSQDSQGRKLLHIVVIVANLPITGVEGHYLKDRIRLWKQGVRDLVMELCCALHNFRVRLSPWQPMVALIGFRGLMLQRCPRMVTHF